MNEISVIMVFLAGVASFLSPCVLPMVPGYITYLAGTSVQRSQGVGGGPKGLLMVRAIAFVSGFSLIFILMGASASALGQAFRESMDTFRQIGGLLIILFGIHLTGLVKIPLLYREARFQGRGTDRGWIGAFLLGMAFGGGWTPCIGPILSSVLWYASMQETLSFGIYLLFIYSLGLAIPFLVAAAALDWVSQFFDRIKPYLNAISIASGLVLILVGILILFDKLNLISSYLPFQAGF